MAATIEHQPLRIEATATERALRVAWVARQVVKHAALLGRRRLALMEYRIRLGVQRIS
jgi:hypothetical protein